MSTPHDSDGPAVTVYVANYNYGRYISRAIDSLLAQTFSDFEIIVIDDGSTDESREIIQRYADSGSIIPVFQQNKGLTVTNNIALRAARGRYIMRLDADDWLDEHALQVLAGVLERSPDVDMVFPDYYLVDVEGRVMEMVRRHDFDEVTLMDQPAHGACTMFRRSALLAAGGYNESLSCQDGYDLWIRFVARHRVQNVNLPLFYYRRHSASLTQNETRILDTRARILSEANVRVQRGLSTYAVVPVRGEVAEPGSLALEKLGDKALIDWTIEAALGAESISRVIVTSPDPDIRKHVSDRFQSKVLVVARERELARINTFADEAILHAVEMAGLEPPDAIAILFIESPFRGSEQIEAAVNVMNVFGADAVISVRPEAESFYVHDGGGLKPLRSGRVLRLEAEEIYRRCGDIEIARLDYLKARATDSLGTMTQPRIGHVIIDQKSAISLRSPLEWRLAQGVLGT